jgi:hypothetical protein
MDSFILQEQRPTDLIDPSRQEDDDYLWYAYQPLFVLGLWVVEYVRGPGPGSNSVVV